MLFRPEAFESLTEEGWDEKRARIGIRAIVADAEERFDPVALWPAEEWDSWGSPTPLTGLYCGAAGVVWALDALRRRGHADVRIDLAAAAQRALERAREAPELSEAEDFELPRASDAGLFSGETGNLVVAWRVGGEGSLEPLIEARIFESRESDANEVMWGAPGGLLAARALLDWTGRYRWAQVWQTTADAVWGARDEEGFWTQRLFGNTGRSLGPAHGLVGIAQALLGGGDLLPADRRDRILTDTVQILERNAAYEGKLANWPPRDGDSLERPDGEPRLQWCHGAPGIVISTAEFLPEELLSAGAELTLACGPARAEEGLVHLPRDRRQRVRLPEDVRAYGGRGVARPRPALRRPCPRSGGAPRKRPLLALDGRPRRCDLRRRLSRRPHAVPDSRDLGLVETHFDCGSSL
jgi:Lanthionine synthetase C-like protein